MSAYRCFFFCDYSFLQSIFFPHRLSAELIGRLEKIPISQVLTEALFDRHVSSPQQAGSNPFYSKTKWSQLLLNARQVEKIWSSTALIDGLMSRTVWVPVCPCVSHKPALLSAKLHKEYTSHTNSSECSTVRRADTRALRRPAKKRPKTKNQSSICRTTFTLHVPFNNKHSTSPNLYLLHYPRDNQLLP